MRLMAIGDVFARPGRDHVQEVLPRLRRQYQPDFIIANAENSAHGFGLTRKIADELFSLGIDALTGGNHIFDNAEVYEFIDREPRLVRPANFPEGTPGKGWTLLTVGSSGLQVAVINLMGRAFMNVAMDCPFAAMDRILAEIPPEITCRVIDFHAEATSEKTAMGWHVDGRASLLWGTHTHVQTADERILPQGMAYISDIGMTGVENSVIGMRTDLSISRMRSARPVRLEPAEGKAFLHGIVVDIEPGNGRATKILRIRC